MAYFLQYIEPTI